MFTDALEVINIIENRRNRGYGFEHFKEYMQSIENPHLQLKAIHVAGTNGKGSTTNDLRSILQEAGYRVGTFTSPYMITHLDRIRINDHDISEQDFLAITNTYYDSWMKWDLSMFEIDMCIACVYFLREQVDICVFEVGLGGRLDFTNILQPLVSVITNIGLDHMEVLGDTYEKIATEKAGIIKENTALITAEKRQECMQVFQEICKHRKSECMEVQDVEHIDYKGVHRIFDYKHYKKIELDSGAKYQCYNAALAIETIEYLCKQNFIACDEVAIREGLRKAIWIGRFEVVSEEPLILLDGAHNMEGIKALCDSIQEIDHPIIIFSVLKDKNFKAMLAQLQQVSDYIIITQLQHHERALDIHELHENAYLHLEDDMELALQKAMELHRPIIVTGSLYFISDMRKKWFQ